ncbi:ATP-binding protein, partial [Sphingomonas sp. LH128]|uniref:ABC transporter transmembrane domain-containing protein n=1 Tax=Sphingomonas sp. LH128 TaxID=473781 RepID=UPI00027CC974
ADTAIIEQIVGTTVSVALRNAIMALGGVIYLFALEPGLTAWLVIAIPVVILPIAAFGRKLRAVSRSSQDRVADIGALTAGFIVDAVSEIAQVPESALHEAPDLGAEGTRVFERVATLGGRDDLVLIVNPRELLDRAAQDLLTRLSKKGVTKAP